MPKRRFATCSALILGSPVRTRSLHRGTRIQTSLRLVYKSNTTDNATAKVVSLNVTRCYEEHWRYRDGVVPPVRHSFWDRQCPHKATFEFCTKRMPIDTCYRNTHLRNLLVNKRTHSTWDLAGAWTPQILVIKTLGPNHSLYKEVSPIKI